MFIERHRNCGLQLTGFERVDDKSIRLGRHGILEDNGISVGTDKNHGYIKTSLNLAAHIQATDLSLDAHLHQYEIWKDFFHHWKGGFTLISAANNQISQPFQMDCNHACCNFVILCNENSGLRHGAIVYAVHADAWMLIILLILFFITSP